MSRTAPPAGRRVLTAALLASCLPPAAAWAAPPPAAVNKPAVTKAAAPAPSAEVAEVSHDVGLSLAKPLRNRLTRAQLDLPQMEKGLLEALGGTEITPEQQQTMQAFLQGAADQKSPASHAMGLAMGAPLHADWLNAQSLSAKDVVRGVGDALDGADSTDETRSKVLAYLDRNKQAIADRNRAKATGFLDANRSKTGVVTTASGLQYKILSPGSGNPPKPTDTVTVRYRGTLADGTEFDGTDQRNNEPASFAVNGVIKGWQEALVLMKPGAKWQLFIPPALAYDTDSEAPIPPGSLLLFTVELLKIGQ